MEQVKQMIKNKAVVLIVSLFAILLVSSSVIAISGLTITVADKFTQGDIIAFNYSISTGALEPEPVWYSPGIYCPHNPILSPGIDVANISVTTPLQKTYTLGVVDDTFISGQCTAIVFILDNQTRSFQQHITKSFTIENTPRIPVEITLCSDAACTNMQSSALIKGQEIHIGYVARPRTAFADMNTIYTPQPISAVYGAMITNPDGTSHEVTLPYNFTAEFTGPYTIGLLVDTNSNYLATKKEFGVIDANAAVIPDELVSLKQERFLMNIKYLEDLRNGIIPPKPTPINDTPIHERE